MKKSKGSSGKYKILFFIACFIFIAIIILLIVSDFNKLVLFASLIADLITIIGTFKNISSNFIDNLLNKFTKNINFDSLKNDWYYEKYYTVLVGRSKEINEITTVLDNTNPTSNIFVLHALGGVGKTSLCRELVEIYDKNCYFTAIIWLQPNKKRFNIEKSETEVLEEDVPFNYYVFVDEIAKKLNVRHKEILALGEKEKQLRELFSTNNYLLVIDGIENKLIIDPIISRINTSHLLGEKSTLFITSREKPESDCITYELKNLSQDSAIEFCYQIAAENNKISSELSSLTQEQITNIINISSGNPLILKALLFELINLSYERLITKYQKPRAEVELYNFILNSHWKQLTNEDPCARKILIYLSQFEATEINSIYESSSFDGELNKIDKALKHLNDLALTETNTIKGIKRIKLHSFVREFVRLKCGVYD